MQSPIRTTDLFKGNPSKSLLPTSLLFEAAKRVLNDPTLSVPSLCYGADPGYQPLREELAAWLSDFYSAPWSSANRICITGGASQNLACMLQVYTDPAYTKNVYMVTPTYHLACRIFEDNGFAGRLRAIPEDKEGIDIEYLEHCLGLGGMERGWEEKKPTKKALPNQKHYRNIIYCTPTFSNPSGKIMTLQRRQQLVRLARQYDSLIIADDVYDFLSWSGECAPPYLESSPSANPYPSPTASPSPPTVRYSCNVPPRLTDIDHILDGGPTSPFGHAVSNGSFSKILGPGVRTGWTEATPLFIAGLSACGSTVSGGAPSQLVAAMIAETLRSEGLQIHIGRVLVPAYRRRRRVAMQAVEKYLLPLGVWVDGERGVKWDSGSKVSADNGDNEMLHNDAEIGRLEGGYYIYVQLPPPMLAETVAHRAANTIQEESVLVGSGDKFGVVGDDRSAALCERGIRICFAWEAEFAIVEGIRRLGKVLEGMIGAGSGTTSA